MDTEITEYIKEWVFYDGDCALCRNWACRLEERLRQRGVGMATLQTEWARELVATANHWSADSLSAQTPDLNRGQAVRAPSEMKVLTSDGTLLGGADALIYLTKYFWWGRGTRLLARLPGARFALRRAYAWIASHRYYVKGGCLV